MIKNFQTFSFLFVFLNIAAACSSQTIQPNQTTLSSKPPLVIAHRGASGALPEHTLAAYALAIEMGADFIEPDLVSTKDGVLIARHENEFSGTSDVAEKFPNRKATKIIDGEKITGWFTEDFTYNEIQRVRAKERLSFRSQANNRRFPIPTFQEILRLVNDFEKKTGKKIGIYPEIKHPTYFQGIGISLEDKLLEELKAASFSPEKNLVFIQCFESEPLQRIAKKEKSWPLIQLLLVKDDVSKQRLQEIKTYAVGIGPDKRMILPTLTDGKLGAPTDLVARAHDVGLLVHPYTFRSDSSFLAPNYKGDPSREYADFFRLGVDAVFSDFPDHAVAARKMIF